jgi:hypothetical protein
MSFPLYFIKYPRYKKLYKYFIGLDILYSEATCVRWLVSDNFDRRLIRVVLKTGRSTPALRTIALPTVRFVSRSFLILDTFWTLFKTSDRTCFCRHQHSFTKAPLSSFYVWWNTEAAWCVVLPRDWHRWTLPSGLHYVRTDFPVAGTLTPQKRNRRHLQHDVSHFSTPSLIKY